MAQRNELIERNLGLVRRIAGKIYEHVRSHVELDELVSLGTAGLVEAAERYDAARSVPFPMFAHHRIRGAIYDGLRRMSHLPRPARGLLAAAQEAANLDELGQSGPAHPPAPGSGPGPVDLRNLHQAMYAATTGRTVSLEAQLEAGHQIPCPHDIPADTALAREHLRRQLADAVRELPWRERYLIEQCYFEGKTLLEAGEALGLSRSWSSRLHARAVHMLKLRLIALGLSWPDLP